MPNEAAGARHIERVLHLRKLDLLGTLPATDLMLLAEYSRERFFPKGSLLLREGEPVAAIYLTIEGRVHVRRQGRDLGCVGSGAGVGGLAVLAAEEEGIEALAEADTLALELDAAAVLEVMEERFSIFHHVLRETCRRYVERLVAGGLRRPPAIPATVPVAIPERGLDLIERISHLRRARPFQRSSINALADLARNLGEVRYPRGVKLWRAGDASGSAMLLVDGVVDCSVPGHSTFQAGPGWPLGSLESLAELPRWYDALTETPLLALHGSSEVLIDVFEDNFRMAADFLASIARELLHSIEDDGRGAALRQFYGCEHAPNDDHATPADPAPGP